MPGQAFTAATQDGAICGTVSGSGRALLLLHGGPAISDYMDLLSGETDGWRTVRYQQRCLPPSATTGPFTVEQHVADAVAVLDTVLDDTVPDDTVPDDTVPDDTVLDDTVPAGQAVVLGHSWGGHLALHLALAHPDRVAGLVLVDGLGAVGDGGLAELSHHLRERLTPAAAARNAEVTARLAGPEPADADMLESLRLMWPAYFADPASAPPMPAHLQASVPGYIGTITSVAGHLAAGFGESLRGLRVPAVFVLGEKSPMPVSQGQQTAALLPAAEVTVVPAAGHLPWHEQPGCITAALARIRELAASQDRPGPRLTQG
jgi:proline iminopeptidase